MTEVVLKGLKAELVEKIKRAREKDKKIVKIVEKMKKARVKTLRSNEWEIEKDLVLKEGKLYVLKAKESLGWVSCSVHTDYGLWYIR